MFLPDKIFLVHLTLNSIFFMLNLFLLYNSLREGILAEECFVEFSLSRNKIPAKFANFSLQMAEFISAKISSLHIYIFLQHSYLDGLG